MTANRFNTLRPMAFRPVAANVIPTQPFQKLTFPLQWFDDLLAVWRKADKNKNRKPESISLPTAALNEVLRAIVPDLICVQSLYRKDLTWLYSSRPVEPADLLSIIRAWAEVCLNDAPEQELQAVISGFKNTDLQWCSSRLTAGWEKHSNGTANPEGDAFTVLPYYLTAELTKQTFELGQEPLQFKRFPLSASSSGAEMLAWPPIWHEENKKTGYFSPYVNLTLQNMPFYSEPLLYVHAGARRFVDPAQKFTNDIKSAIIHTPISWLKGLDYTHSLQVANTHTYHMGPKKYEFRWDDNLIKIIDRLNIGKPLPQANELLGQGKNFRHGTTEALLLYNTRIGGHAVSAGMSAADRSELFNQLAEQIAPGWERVSDYGRVDVQVSFSSKTPFVTENEEPKDDNSQKETTTKSTKKPAVDNVAGRCERIKLAVGDTARLVVCYQNPATVQAITTELQSLLGTSFDPVLKRFKTKFGFVLHLHTEKAGELAAELPYNYTGWNLRKQEQAYVAAKAVRQGEIATRFPKIQNNEAPIGVLFELTGHKTFQENCDPKQAIRQGFAAQGYLTQFLDADLKLEKNLTHRVRKALLDLLRQWGVLSHAPTLKSVSLQATHYLGIWVIRMNSRFDKPQTEVPVAVRVSNNTIQVKGPDFDWTSYANAQILLAKPTDPVTPNERKSAVLIWLRDLLNNLPDNTLLLMDAHNVRSIWNSIQNKNLQVDRLVVDGHVNKAVIDCNGLRVVRIRQDKTNEAPLVFGVRDTVNGVEPGYANGVFRMADRVFASAGEKPTTAKASAKSSKYRPYSTNRGDFDADPNYQVWNPRVCELTIAGMQPGDDPALWAAVVHQLRDMALQFDDMTTLPLPLHLADKLEEYVKI